MVHSDTAQRRLPITASLALSGNHPDGFGQRVQQCFQRGAPHYERQARLQQAVAWRLAHLSSQLDLPEGPCVDLGAGTGLLSRALTSQLPQLRHRPLLQLDLCPELLARNPLSGSCSTGLGTAGDLVWDLNNGLPEGLERSALLASNFALQWLEQPQRQLRLWCRCLAPGGWLLLAVPTAGSFPQWHQAAERAGVPCSALSLPDADALIAAVRAAGIEPHHCRQLRFSRPDQGGLTTLRHLRQLGAHASRTAPLSTSQLRRLLAHWPAASSLTWSVLLLIARRPPGTAP